MNDKGQEGDIIIFNIECSFVCNSLTTRRDLSTIIIIIIIIAHLVVKYREAASSTPPYISRVLASRL
jgi:hypothetical protein